MDATEPLIIHNGDRLTVTDADGTKRTYVVESGGFSPDVIPLYNPSEMQLTCRKVDEPREGD